MKKINVPWFFIGLFLLIPTIVYVYNAIANPSRQNILNALLVVGVVILIFVFIKVMQRVSKTAFYKRIASKVESVLPKRERGELVSYTSEPVNPYDKKRSSGYVRGGYRGRAMFKQEPDRPITGADRFKAVLLFFGGLAVFVFLIWFVSTVILTPKESVTAQQVQTVMYEHGYHPQDITEKYYIHDPDFKDELENCVAFEEEGIHFEFFEFNNDDSSYNVYKQAIQLIVEEQGRENDRKRKGSFVSNYASFWLETDGRYGITVYVGNTVAYVTCPTEKSDKVLQILEDIDYMEY